MSRRKSYDLAVCLPQVHLSALQWPLCLGLFSQGTSIPAKEIPLNLPLASGILVL